jgi:nucleoside 2-deoxyribosyltransferase
MAYQLFVSHSVAWGDELLIAQFCEQAQKRGQVSCHVARRNWKFGPSVIFELEDAIQSADCVLAIVMNDGSATSYVNQELGIARRLGKPIIAIVEESPDRSPLVEKVPDLLVVNLDSPDECAANLFRLLAALEAARPTLVAVAWIILATLGQIFVSRG